MVGGGSADLVGAVLAGRYQVTGRIGQGGMGTVYEAVQLALGRPVAIKVITGDASQVDRSRFVQEALAAAALGHPNIVQVMELADHEDAAMSGAGAGRSFPFLVMERLHGASLRDVIVRDGRMSAERTRAIGIQILAGLDAAHRAQILHRDIKPPNVFLASGAGVKDFVKLLDFGIAKLTADPGAVQTATGAVLGTPAYLPPERLRGAPADVRADLYAVGLCLREMLTGARTFGGSGVDLARAVFAGAPPLAPVAYPFLDGCRDLVDVVERAISVDPGRRFGSASEMRAALEGSGMDRTRTAMVGLGGGAAVVGPSAHPPPARAYAHAPPQLPLPPQPAPQDPAPLGTHQPPRSRNGLLYVVVVLVTIGVASVLAVVAFALGASRAFAPAPSGSAVTAGTVDASAIDGASAAPSAALGTATPTATGASAASAARSGGAPSRAATVADAAAPKPAGAGRTCNCDPTPASVARQNSSASLCPASHVSKVPRCFCERADSVLLAATVEQVNDLQRVRAQFRSPCSGFATKTSPRENGVFTNCVVCEDGARYTGQTGEACTGFSQNPNMQGVLLQGGLDCFP